jgi:hypothetical protein
MKIFCLIFCVKIGRITDKKCHSFLKHCAQTWIEVNDHPVHSTGWCTFQPKWDDRLS